MISFRSTWATAPKLPTLLLLSIAVLIQGAYPRYQSKEMAPITRQGLAWINELGGAQDAEGDYQRPFYSYDAFGVVLSDGWHIAPMAWDEDGHRMTFYVERGYVVRQGYQFIAPTECKSLKQGMCEVK